MGRTLILLFVGSSFCLSILLATAAGSPRPAVEFPLPVDRYEDQQISSLFGKLTARTQREPLNKLNQHAIALRPPLLVGFFLAALVIHGGCQQWWIGPVLESLSKWPLMSALPFSLLSMTMQRSLTLHPCPRRRCNRNSQLAKSGRSINPDLAIWRGRSFAVVPFSRSPDTHTDRRSCVYVASLN
jgi:hypothetical protein